MSYALYKETTYPRSCTLTPGQLEDMIGGVYNGVEVHAAVSDEDSSGEVPQFLRFVSREEIIDKLDSGKVIGFVKSSNDKLVPKLEGVRGKIIFYRVSW